MEINSVESDPFVGFVDDSQKEAENGDIKNVVEQTVSSQPLVEGSLQGRHIEQLDSRSPIDRSQRAVASNPGGYSPMELFEAGLYFVKEQDFDQAAMLITGAICRAEIDVRICQDKSATAVVSEMVVTYARCFNSLPKKDQTILNRKIEEMNQTFEIWDKETPRAYDPCWLQQYIPEKISFAQVDEASKKAIIERAYRYFRGEYDPSEEALREDEYFFDLNLQKFYLREPSLVITIPIEVQPITGRFGKYTSLFSLPRGTVEIRVISGYSCSLEDEYQGKLKEYAEEPECQITRSKMRNGIDTYKLRYLSDDFFDIHYCFIHEQHNITFFLDCLPEHEAECTSLLEALLESIEFLAPE